MSRAESVTIFTPSTPESHRIFDEEELPITRQEFRRLRKQVKETRTAIQ